ncbi:unnamed protein product [Durusdinium trenchii]|uniref:Reverse transcriptase Ty1/copia-type domain-containing protein n=1 Tax=Durusdinium trenchii TaxID=1381693 RepID=A0ABP0K6A4_9DINO
MEKSATPQKVMELFSPPRVSIKAVAQGLTLTEPSNFDLTEGWDALNYQHRQDMWKVLREQKPDVVIMSPERAQVYPEDMVQTVIDGILAGPVEFSGVAADDHDLMDEEAEDQEEAEPQPRTPGTLQRDSSVLLTEEQKKKILRMHLNMGHLSKEQMLSMLKAAGAREGVLKFVKEKFGCELQDLIAQGRSTKAGAVDVTTEGTPDDTGDGKVPSIEIDKPMVQESIAHDLRTADTAKDIESEGQHLPLRQVSVPRPVIPEETEGSVADTVSEATAGSKRKSRHSDQDSASNKKKIVEETVVKRPVEDQEQANLEKIALKTLRRLEREEKMRKISERKEAVASASSETPNQETTSSSSSMALQQPSTETSADGFAPQDALMAELTEQGLSFLELKIEDSCLMTKPVKTKSQEFDMKLATDEEKKGFKASDEAEWKTILDLKAVEVLNPAESRKVRRDHPHRILPSRFVRRKKPMPGLGQWKFKSRWCVLGHCDPDTGSYSTYSPMPMTESISIFFQLCTNMDMSVTFCDVTQAFCQSEPLDRPEGDLYVEACEGLGLPEGTVIRLVAPVYGLEDAPLRWHQTVINFLRSLGFERSLLEPCWYVRRDARNEVEAMILVEVDDLNVATRKDVKDELLSALNQRFRFGKMEYDEADFAGRHVRVLPGRIEMNQEKYIIEKLHPLKLPLGRKGDKSSRLKPDEFEAFRSMLYKVAWVAHQTRPEAAGVVSILSSRLKEGTIEDVSCLNKLIQHLRNTAQQSLTLHRFSNDKMILIAASDAGGVDSLPPDKSSEIDNVQGAWIIMAADRLPSANQRIKVSILSWRSSKLRRRVASTLASEALAFSQSLSEVEWIQIMIRDIIKGDVKRTDWTESLTPYVPVLKENCELAEKLEQCHVTDAKSLFDALKKESPMSRQDRRTSVELSIILEALQKARSVIRWAPHPRMVADGLTKADITRTNGALEELLRTSRLTLWDEKQELNLRKDDPAAKGRSRRASTRHRSLEASEESFALLSRINKNLGVLSQDAAAHAAGSPPEAAHAVGFESLSAAEQETYHQEHAAEELAYQEALKARKILEEELEEKIGQLLLCTSGGSILRLQVSEVEVMKRRQGGRCLMKVERSDSLISACLLSAVDAERDAPHSAECEREQVLTNKGMPTCANLGQVFRTLRKPVWRANFAMAEWREEAEDLDMRPEAIVSRLYLKVEYETLRRLPRHPEYLVFTIRPYMDPLPALGRTPLACRALAGEIRRLPEERGDSGWMRRWTGLAVGPAVLDYKGLGEPSVRAASLAFLDAVCAASGGITNLYEGGTRSDYIVVAHPEYALGRVGSGRGFDQKWDQSKVATRPPGGPMTLRLRDAGAELLQRVTVPLQTLPNPRERVLAKKCSSAGRIGQKLPGLDQDFQAFLHVLRSVLGDAEPSHFRRTRDEDVQSRPLGYDGRLTSGYFNNITEAGVSSHRRQTHDCLLELARRYVSDPEAVACELRLNGSWRYWARELQLVLRQERKLFDQQRTKAETLELQLRMAALA